MKKIMFFLALLVFVAACTSGNNGPATTPFVGGMNALTMSFGPQAPPNEIFDDGQFDFSILVELENRGEHNIEQGEGYVFIEGINAGTFGVTDNDLVQDIPEIQGTRKNVDGTILPGFKDVVTFDNLNYQSDISGDLQVNMRAFACYNYRTRTSTNICIKEETIDSLQDQEVCQINGRKQVQNSGAPIHITSLQQSSLGRESIQITFDITHVGPSEGTFYRKGAVCDRRVNNPERYDVFVDVAPIVGGTINADCSGFQDGSGNAGHVKLFQGQPRTISCRFDLSSVTSNFIEPLSITLDYRYQHFIQKNVVVKDISVN